MDRPNYGHTLLLQQVAERINGETKTTTHVHIIVVGRAIQGASGVEFLRAMLGI